MRSHITIAMSLAAMLVAVPAGVDARQPAGTTSNVTVPDKSNALTDAEFLKKAAQSNMTEVDLGQVAVHRANSPVVKQFAQRMIDDHTKANNELMAIARQEGVQIPKQIGTDHRQAMDRLSKLDGPDFDHAYMRYEMDQHARDVALFQRHADVGHDAQVKAWVQKTLPTLQQHEQLAKEDATKLGMNVVTGQAQGTSPPAPDTATRGQASR